MDGYIKKSEAVDVIVKYPYEIAGKTATAIKMIEDLPTADVVPKSEYEMLQGALKSEERHNELTMEMAKKALQNAKAEVASKIFAEIEKHLIFNAYGIATISDKTFAELKKKYTEGEE
jgi:hypothetical protein